MAHVVQVANFVSPTSGGIRTALARLRAGYVAAGHRATLVIPGPEDRTEQTGTGPVVQLRAPRLPLTGGYRVMVDVGRVTRLLERIEPDVIEVSDRFTLRGLGTWARQEGVRSTVVVHERLDRLASMHVPFPLRATPWARRDNAALAARFDTVVCPSRWAADEFVAAGVEQINVVGWGVDLERFDPARRSPVLRRRLLGDAEILLALVCRLSPEKKPESAIDAVRALVGRRVPVRLVVAGTGASEAALRRRARDLPITFLGHLEGRDHVAELLASADVAICPGPVETFGLAALESLASGTPVVSSRSGAIAEVLREPFGRSAYNHGPAMAGAVRALLMHGEAGRRAARREAEEHPWERAIARMLDLHGLTAGADAHP